MLNVALPSVSDDLGVGVSEMQWVVNGYFVTMLSLMLIAGSFGDICGHRRTFLVGLAVFACGALVARNGWQADTSARVAFVTATMPPHSYSSERADVIGRAGDALRPEGLYCWDLGQRGTAEVSPCAAYQVLLEIPPGATRDVTFALGEGADQGEARRLARRWSSPGAAADTLPQVDAAWERRLGAVEVKTPDPAFDVMVNHWLLYQMLPKVDTWGPSPKRLSVLPSTRDEAQQSEDA